MGGRGGAVALACVNYILNSDIRKPGRSNAQCKTEALNSEFYKKEGLMLVVPDLVNVVRVVHGFNVLLFFFAK